MTNSNPDLGKLDLARLMEQLLGATGGDKHPLGALLKGLQSNFAAGAKEKEKEKDKESQRAWKLEKKRNRILKKACRLFHDRNEFVAAALGACGCWGQDSECEMCGGDGLPGFYVPEEAAFEALIVPFLQAQSSLVERYLPKAQQEDSKAG